MAGDFDSSLPVRTVSVEELQVQTKVGTNLSTDLKRVNGTTVSVNTGTADAGTQRVTLASDQAAIDVDVTGSVTDVDDDDIADSQTLPLNINLSYAHNGTSWERLTSISGALAVQSTDLDIRDLTHVSDSIKLGDGTDFLAINADGSINITDNGGSLTVDALNLDIRDLTHVSDSVKIGDGTDFLAINADGSINVAVSGTGDKVNVFDQNTSGDIATNATSTHTYTPAADFYLTDVITSASGKFKVEIKTGVTGSEVTRVVLFTQSERQAPWHLTEPLLVATTDSVKIIRTNLDNQAQPLYSTVQGYEV
jgi:hypothetical protein